MNESRIITSCLCHFESDAFWFFEVGGDLTFTAFFQMSQMAFTANNSMQLQTITLGSGGESPAFLCERAEAFCAPAEWGNWPQVYVNAVGTHGQHTYLPCNETQFRANDRWASKHRKGKSVRLVQK